MEVTQGFTRAVVGGRQWGKPGSSSPRKGGSEGLKKSEHGILNSKNIIKRNKRIEVVVEEGSEFKAFIFVLFSFLLLKREFVA